MVVIATTKRDCSEFRECSAVLAPDQSPFSSRCRHSGTSAKALTTPLSSPQCASRSVISPSQHWRHGQGSLLERLHLQLRLLSFPAALSLLQVQLMAFRLIRQSLLVTGLKLLNVMFQLIASHTTSRDAFSSNSC